MLTTKAIEELQQIWKDETGEDLNREETAVMGVRLLRSMRVIERASAERRNREGAQCQVANRTTATSSRTSEHPSSESQEQLSMLL